MKKWISIYLCFSPILFSFFVIRRFLSGVFLTANPISQRISIYYRDVMFCFQINCHGRERSSHTSHQCNTTATHSSVSSRCRKDSEIAEHSIFLYKPLHYTKQTIFSKESTNLHQLHLFLLLGLDIFPGIFSWCLGCQRWLFQGDTILLFCCVCCFHRSLQPTWGCQ